MIVNLYAIFDTCSGVYDGPFKARTDGEALRAFTNIAVDGNHPVGQNPEDFHLSRVGRWDDAKGDVIPEATVNVATALEAIAASRRIEPGSLKEQEVVPIREADSNGDAHGFVREEDIINAS